MPGRERSAVIHAAASSAAPMSPVNSVYRPRLVAERRRGTCVSACIANLRARRSHRSSPVRSNRTEGEPVTGSAVAEAGVSGDRACAPDELAAGGQKRAVRLVLSPERRQGRDEAGRPVAPLNARRGTARRADGERRPVRELLLHDRGGPGRGDRMRLDRPRVLEPLWSTAEGEHVTPEPVCRAQVPLTLAVQVLGPQPVDVLTGEQRTRAGLPQLGEASLAGSLVHRARRQHRSGGAKQKLVRRVLHVRGDRVSDRISGRPRRRQPVRDDQDAARTDEQRTGRSRLVRRTDRGLVQRLRDRRSIERRLPNPAATSRESA